MSFSLMRVSKYKSRKLLTALIPVLFVAVIVLTGIPFWGAGEKYSTALIGGSSVAVASIQPDSRSVGNEGVGGVVEKQQDSEHGKSAEHPAKKISMLFIIPFVCILLSIAIIPLINGEWWHHNYSKIAVLWGLPIAITMFFILRDRTIQTFVEYLSFIALVGSLFTISGGILIRANLRCTPATNVAVMAVGAVLASIIGTAGASIILVRLLLRINQKRGIKMHIFIFFIFVVSNIGGALTPLGDPPLFLGFLQGVPFEWTLVNLFPAWAFNIVVILVFFLIIDTIILRREGGLPCKENKEPVKIEIEGLINFVFLGGILGTVLLYGYVLAPELGHIRYLPDFIQIVLMWGMAGLSLAFTSKAIREENGFTWFPVKEVAVLFAGIFACMIPALDLLEYMGSTGQINVTQPWQFFWLTGGLSSFLDNAPTYLTFVSLAKTVGGSGCIPVTSGCVPHEILLAISMGAVFMGANTYIGNAPNFMVKSISEEGGVQMPSFFGYMAWSFVVLIPLFIVDTLIFF